MSWDVFISRTPVDQLEDAEFESMGKKNEVIGLIAEVLPGVDFSDSQWGVYGEEEFSIEFNMGDDEEQQHIMLHIRGGGEKPIMVIKELCEKLGCYAMDGSTGEQMNFDEVDINSFKAWQAYRDKIIKNN